MARAYKCDICGSFYDEYQNCDEEDKFYVCKVDDREFAYVVDMCPHCIEAIQEWVVKRRNLWAGIEEN